MSAIPLGSSGVKPGNSALAASGPPVGSRFPAKSRMMPWLILRKSTVAEPLTSGRCLALQPLPCQLRRDESRLLPHLVRTLGVFDLLLPELHQRIGARLVVAQRLGESSATDPVLDLLLLHPVSQPRFDATPACPWTDQSCLRLRLLDALRSLDLPLPVLRRSPLPLSRCCAGRSPPAPQQPAGSAAAAGRVRYRAAPVAPPSCGH